MSKWDDAKAAVWARSAGECEHCQPAVERLSSEEIENRSDALLNGSPPSPPIVPFEGAAR